MNSKNIYLIIFIFFGVGIFSILLYFIFYQDKESKLPINTSNLLSNIQKTKEKKVDPKNFYAPVLLYHHIAKKTPQQSYYVSPEVFEEQMKWLKENNYHVISIDKFYNAATGNGTLPDKPVVITFDDSLLDQYQNAYPILKKYNFPATFFVKMNNIGKLSLSWEKIKEMSDNGMTIGSHTVNHDALTSLSNTTLNKELVDSKKTIEDHIGKNVDYLSYPGGAYDSRVILAAESAGYKMAVTTKHLVNQKMTNHSSIYQIPRVHIDNEMGTFTQWVQGKNLK